jgi:hypothetical protein
MRPSTRGTPGETEGPPDGVGHGGITLLKEEVVQQVVAGSGVGGSEPLPPPWS